MKRESKFRAWDHKNNCMINYDEDNTLMVPCNLGVLFLDPGIEQNRYSILDFPVMQYTGLKDNNSKEAYHKDIIQTSVLKKIYVIEWNFEMFGFYNERQIWIPLYKYRGLFEVIGNIHSNPELL